MNPLEEIAQSLCRWQDEFKDGHPEMRCQTGDAYQEFFFCSLARPNDVDTIRQLVRDVFTKNLTSYLEGGAGPIYWRIRPEWDEQPDKTVARFHDDGPDVDFVTDRRCFLDRNWIRIAGYCRLFRSRQAPQQAKAA